MTRVSGKLTAQLPHPLQLPHPPQLPHPYKSRFFTFMDIYLRVRGLPVPSPWQGEG
jgi:hypothetical protein